MSNPDTFGISEFAELGFVQRRELFAQPLGHGESIIEAQDLIDAYNPSRPGMPVLDEVPAQAEEAVAIMLDDMRQTFSSGLYVLRFLFRQGDVTKSDDPNFHRLHRDFNGTCLATYAVSSEDPTLAVVDDEERSGQPFQVVRMRGDIFHRRPLDVNDTRTTVIGNITDQQTFNRIRGGAFAEVIRAAGILKPVRY